MKRHNRKSHRHKLCGPITLVWTAIHVVVRDYIVLGNLILKALTKPGCNLLRALQKLIPVVKGFHKFPFLLYYFSDSSFFDVPFVSSINCVQFLTLNSWTWHEAYFATLFSPTFPLLPSIWFWSAFSFLYWQIIAVIYIFFLSIILFLSLKGQFRQSIVWWSHAWLLVVEIDVTDLVQSLSFFPGFLI